MRRRGTGGWQSLHAAVVAGATGFAGIAGRAGTASSCSSGSTLTQWADARRDRLLSEEPSRLANWIAPHRSLDAMLERLLCRANGSRASLHLETLPCIFKLSNIEFEDHDVFFHHVLD